MDAQILINFNFSVWPFRFDFSIFAMYNLRENDKNVKSWYYQEYNYKNVKSWYYQEY